MPRKVGAYIRVGTEEQASAIEGSLDNQRYRLKSFVDMKKVQEKNWGEITEFYVDDGYSAKDTNRPAWRWTYAFLLKLAVAPEVSDSARGFSPVDSLNYEAEWYTV